MLISWVCFKILTKEKFVSEAAFICTYKFSEVELTKQGIIKQEWKKGNSKKVMMDKDRQKEKLQEEM